MKFGVLCFSYAGAAKSTAQVADRGFYTVNLGDGAQTIAARQALHDLGVPSNAIIAVDRDTLPAYAGEPVALVMNGVFYDRNFPVPATITPIFVGFCTKSAALVRDHRAWFLEHGPVGCRDHATARLMADEGIPAFVTGCVTMTLPARDPRPSRRRVLVVYGSGAGELPAAVLKHIPPSLADRTELIFHRLPSGEIPLRSSSLAWIERYEQHLLDRYRNEASLVLTPLLHVASPCLAMGVPVIVCRRNRDTRFGHLETLTRIYTPDEAATIDWAPKTIDLAASAEALRGVLGGRLQTFR